MRQILLPLLSFVFSSACCLGELAAQGYSKKAEIDSISYLQYMNGDARALRQTLKTAQESGVDFFYLRLRASLLYARLGRYEWAYPHALRLMQINPYDTLAQRLWWLSLRYTGRKTEELRWLSSCDSATFHRLTGTDRERNESGIQWESATLGIGYLMEENFKARRDGGYLEAGSLYTERTLQGPMNVLGVAIEGRLGKPYPRNKAYRWKTVQSLGVFQSHPHSAWEALNQNPALDNQRFSKSYSIVALQYHGLLEYTPTQVRDGAIGLIWGTFTENSRHLSSVWLPDSNRLAPVDCLYSNQSLMAAIFGRYRFNGGEMMTSMGYANLAKQPQFQFDAGLTWYPRGRSSLFYTGSWSGLLSLQTDAVPVRQILSHKLSCWVNKKWLAEAEYVGSITASGPQAARGLSNYTRPLTFQTFNTIEPILNLAGVGFIRYHRIGTVRLGYQRQIRETTYYNIRWKPGSTTETILELNPKKHILHFLNLSLTWKLNSST